MVSRPSSGASQLFSKIEDNRMDTHKGDGGFRLLACEEVEQCGRVLGFPCVGEIVFSMRKSSRGSNDGVWTGLGTSGCENRCLVRQERPISVVRGPQAAVGGGL